MASKLAVPSKAVGRKATSVRGKPSPRLSEATLKKLKDVFQVLADESRLKILLALAQAGEMHVTSLCELLGTPAKPVSQPAVSHHLSLLRMNELVACRRDGKHNFYRLDGSNLGGLIEQFFAGANGQKHFEFTDFSLAYRSK